MSTSYYALFHMLSKTCADIVVGKTNKNKIRRAWSQAYRSVNHNRVRQVCDRTRQNNRVRAAFKRFPEGIQQFGRALVELQQHRHRADYDPLQPALTLSGVKNFIDDAEDAMKKFGECSPLDKRAFCTFILFDLRE